MNQPLFALGLFIFGFTLLFIMPAAQHRNWKEMGSRPPAGETIVLMMRFMGLFLIMIGFLMYTGAIDLESLAPVKPKG